jgi:hypothetical protein
MCGFVAVRLINFKGMSAKRKNALKKEIQRRKKQVQAQLNDLHRALRHVTQKPKRRTTRRRRRR